MDLAKIRKKSLLAASKDATESSATPASSPVPVVNITESSPVSPVTPKADLFQAGNDSTEVALPVPAAALFAPTPPESVVVTRTPMEAILAGRTAAGCDEESILADDLTTDIVTESQLEFLCFRVSDEVYGINIMDIKEIIKPREVTEVPRAPLFVSGVLSLRGTIIPIIDMRVRLGLTQKEPTGKERIVVIKNSNSFSGLLVDEVIKVVQIQVDDVETAPAILDGIDRDFVSGLGRSDGRLIIILNLENIADINLY